MTLPKCVLCGRECIPLADYDVPVCYRCDDRMTVVLDVAADLDTLRATVSPSVAPTEPASPAVSPVLFDELREWRGERKTA